MQEGLDSMSQSSNGKTVKIRQIGSPLRRADVQRRTLIGLGLNKMNRERTLEDTRAVRGMIKKVAHLICIVEEHDEHREEDRQKVCDNASQ